MKTEQAHELGPQLAQPAQWSLFPKQIQGMAWGWPDPLSQSQYQKLGHFPREPQCESWIGQGASPVSFRPDAVSLHERPLLLYFPTVSPSRV